MPTLSLNAFTGRKSGSCHQYSLAPVQNSITIHLTMKTNILIALLLPAIFIGCSKSRFKVTPDFHIKEGDVEYR